MKLSDFLKVKKLIFSDKGEVELINNLSVGNVEFYELTQNKVKEIKDKLIDKLNSNYDQELFMYDVFPFVCSIERDITFEQFKQLVNAPTYQFYAVLNIIVDIINNLFKLAKEANEINTKVNNMRTQNPELFIQEESIEDKIKRLTKEMEEEKDTKIKRQKLLELAKLYEEVEKSNG